MPIHDWSRVFHGAFHDFHTGWNIELRTALNNGLLPPEYYALVEQVARPTVPDVLTLQSTNGIQDPWSTETPGGVTTVATAPPRVKFSGRAEVEDFTHRQRSVVVRHSSDDRIIAVIEILSAGNKSSKRDFQAFVNKAVDALERGYHLLLIDLHPRTRRDPEGIHPVIWDEVGGAPMPVPPDKPLTLAAYDAGPPRMAYVEPVAVGDTLIDMPLFLAPGAYVSVPLEATYQSAYRGVPRRFREVLDAEN
ncbi:MAG: DUF4058 family protein [Isosphaeraceae bacterium]